jgi:two-component system cell cycle sensor histidine kinase/response regulator CckA
MGDGGERLWNVPPHEGLFRTLVENALIGVYVFQDRIIYCNKTFERILGREARDIYNSDIFSFIHPEDRTMVARRAAYRLEGKLAPEPYTVRILTPEGDIRWVMLLAQRVTVGGRPALLGHIMDITELKDAQLQVESARALLEELFQGSPEAIALLDKEGRVERVNEAFERTFGWSADEAAGAFLWELLEPDQKAKEGARDQEMILSGHLVRLETKSRKKDGSLLDVEFTGFPVRVGGEIRGAYAIYRDITEKKKAIVALERAERRYRELVEQVPAGVYEIDVETARFLTVNEYMCRLFGYTREEFLSMTGFDLWTDEGKEILRQRIEAVLRGRPIPQVVEYPGKTKEGKDLIVRIHSRFGQDDSGRPIARVVMVDVTEQRRLEEQFLQAQKMEAIGRLAGGVAHDINNALMSVMGYADLILMNLGEAHPLAEAAKEIKEGARRAASVTSQLLAFSRKQLIMPKVIDLNDLMESMAKILRRILGEDIKLEVRFSRRPVWVKVDPNQMEQVIMNLAVNARDAMPQGGRLSLRTDLVELDEASISRMRLELDPGSYGRFTMEDTGLGMDRETMKHIFEPFFTTKELGRGTGLGLSTVYGIVKQAKGDIFVRSEPGKGTTFDIYLPLHPEPSQMEERPSERGDLSPLKGTETILVVEDSEPVRRLVKTTLERFGYKIMEAPDAETALKMLEGTSQQVSLIITDVVLPGISGPQLAEKAVVILPGVKVLYVSGYPREHLKGWKLQGPEFHLVEKPFSPLELVKKVRDLLDR